MRRPRTKFAALFALAAIASFARADQPLRIAIIGDETCRPREGLESPWPARLEAILEDRGVDVELIDVTVDGMTTADALDRFNAEVLAAEPDFVIVQLGRSDSLPVEGDDGRFRGKVSKREFEANLRRLVNRTLDARRRIILVTCSPLLWTPALKAQLADVMFQREARWGADVGNRTFASRVTAVAGEYVVPVVDVHTMVMKHDGRDFHEAEELIEGTHLTDLGQKIVAERIVLHVERGRPRAGFDIPQIDLADDETRRVVVDREPGQYLGHVTTTLLEDGHTIIAVYPQGHGRGPIVMKRSEDGGRTWSDRLPVPENWATSQETPTIHRVIDPRMFTTRLLLFSSLHPLRCARGDEFGREWSPLEPVGTWGGIVVMSALVPLPDGRLLGMFHDDGRFFTPEGVKRDTMTVYRTFSADGGLSWARPRAIYNSADVHLCEPGIVRAPDSGLLAALLRENRRVANSQVMISQDNGASWLPPRPLAGALTGDRHTAREAPDGRIVVTFRDMGLDSPTRGDWVAWVGRWRDIIRGDQGDFRIRLMDNHHDWDCGYAGLERLPDGTFVATSYGHWTEGEEPYIVSVRFTLAEMDALETSKRRNVETSKQE